MEKLIERASEVVSKFNQAQCQGVSDEVKNAWRRSLEQTGLIEFGAFACPSINARLLYSNQPESYVLTRAEGSSFERGDKDLRIAKLLQFLRETGVESTFRAIVGDSDEDDYLFPVIAPPLPLDSSVLESRRVEFVTNLAARMTVRLGWPVAIDRCSEIALLFDDQLPTVDLTDPQCQEDMAIEFCQIGQNFGPGKYYDGIRKLSEAELREMVRCKFASYAKQGFMLSQLYPDLVLIQNEFPLDLRTRMLNRLNIQLGLSEIPVIYPIPDRRKI